MHYEQHIKNLTTEDTCSAQRAIDYLDGYHRPYLEEILDSKHGGIKRWRERGVKPVWENVLGLIIERSAKTYKDQPKRDVLVGGEVSEDATARYLELLKMSNWRGSSMVMDRWRRLLKTAIVVPQWIDENNTDEFLFSIVSRHNADVDYDPKTGEIKSLCYTANACGPQGGRLYHYWQNEVQIDLETIVEKNSVMGVREVSRQANPYGIIPAAVAYDINKPAYSVWAKPVWEQLTYLNEAVSMFHTETKFNSRYAIGSLFTNLEVPEGFVTGPDTHMQANGEAGITPFVEYRSPDWDDKFLAWLDSLKQTVADQWGINLDIGGTGSANSGFQLVVEEFATLEMMQDRINSAKDFERKLYKVISTMGEVHGLGLPVDGELSADFDEPSLPVNKVEDWNIWKEQIALGLKTKRDFWKWENPDLTDEQLDEMEAKAQQPTLGSVPNFDEGV